jgi:hypothetical protein
MNLRRAQSRYKANQWRYLKKARSKQPHLFESLSGNKNLWAISSSGFPDLYTIFAK